MYPKPPNRRVLACAAALALLCVGCAKAESFELTRVQRSDVRVLPGADGFTHPLTGVVSYVPQEWQERPVLAIKVGNSANERPQAGLDRADLIYEELVEGGVTRFMVLYSTNQVPRVGPVRSVRSVDPAILEPIGGLFAYSGGVPPVVSQLRATSGITDVGANVVGGAYRRDDNRDAPYNLYTTTDELWSGRDGSPPDQVFSFLSSADDPTVGGDQAATNVSFSFAGNGTQIKYTFDEETGKYGRLNGDTPHLIEGEGDGVQLSFRNVLVQQVDIFAGAVTDRAGQRTTDADLIGDGPATLFRGGRAIRGSWTRGSDSEITRFTDGSGEALKLAPGETIVELLPKSRELSIS